MKDFDNRKLRAKLLWGILITLVFLVAIFIVFAFYNHESISTIDSLY